jgi:hypothetical protein
VERNAFAREDPSHGFPERTAQEGQRGGRAAEALDRTDGVEDLSRGGLMCSQGAVDLAGLETLELEDLLPRGT